MKKYFILICIFSFKYMYSQSLTVIYDAYTVHNSQDLINVMPSLKGYDVIYKYSLSISKGKSKFSRDSLMILANLGNHNEIWCSQVIYKDYKNDLWIETGGAYKKNNGYVKSLNEMSNSQKDKWEITSETCNVLGMRCIKATKGQHTAWFTKEIPISDGPQYGNFGLPGLVLIYEDSFYKWEATGISYNNSLEILIPKLNLETKDHLIKIEFNEYKSLPSKEVLFISRKSPLKKWLNFE